MFSDAEDAKFALGCWAVDGLLAGVSGRAHLDAGAVLNARNIAIAVAVLLIVIVVLIVVQADSITVN